MHMKWAGVERLRSVPSYVDRVATGVSRVQVRVLGKPLLVRGGSIVKAPSRRCQGAQDDSRGVAVMRGVWCL